MSLFVYAIDYENDAQSSTKLAANQVYYYFVASSAAVVPPTGETSTGGALYSLPDGVEIATRVVFANTPEGRLIPNRT